LGADSTGIINALTLRLRAQTEGLTAPDRKAQDTFMQIAQLNEQKRQRQAIQAAAREQHDIADAVRFHAVLEKTKQMRAKAAGAIMADASEVPDEYKDQADDFVSGQQGTLTANRARKDADDELQSQKDEAIAGEALKNWPKDQPMTAAAIRAKGFTPRVAGHALRLAGFERLAANDADSDAARLKKDSDREAESAEFQSLDEADSPEALDALTLKSPKAIESKNKRREQFKVHAERAADDARATMAFEALKKSRGVDDARSNFYLLKSAVKADQEKRGFVKDGGLFGGKTVDEAGWGMANPKMRDQWAAAIKKAGEMGIPVDEAPAPVDKSKGNLDKILDSLTPEQVKELLNK